MSERPEVQTSQRFLDLNDNEYSLHISEGEHLDLFSILQRIGTSWRVDPVFDNVIVDKQTMLKMRGQYQFTDQSQKVRDFLTRPEATRILGGNIHSMIIYNSGYDMIFRVQSNFYIPEPLPDNNLVLRMDEVFEKLPLPQDYESTSEAIGAYKEYAAPRKSEWLKEARRDLKRRRVKRMLQKIGIGKNRNTTR